MRQHFLMRRLRRLRQAILFIREKMEIDNDVQRLKLLKASYDNQRYGLQDNFMIKYPKLIKTATEKLANVREDVKARDKELIDNPDLPLP